MSLQSMILRFRAKRLNRQMDALLRRARRPHVASAHLVGHAAPVATVHVHVHDVANGVKPAWFACLTLAAAFCAGYVVADDKRIGDIDLHAELQALACNAGYLASINNIQSEVKD